ncbi:MAG: hypothetical protein B6D35_02340 [Candidatus Brocadia sp. UTAMX2]|jgi:hypothetical protein|nr:MAG: hypothetical protein B6D35_02340 [Candidatus Brocadia sp. UTAMX2]
MYTLQEQKVIMFDTGQVLADEKGLIRARYSRDFLHLNKVGYEALNGKLIEILKALMSIKPTNEV